MTNRAEPATLLAVPLGLLASRALGLDAPAVWFAAAVALVVHGWGLMRLLRLERHAGLGGALPVSIALGLVVWTPALALGFLVHLPFGAVLALAVAAGWIMAVAALRRPPALESVTRLELAAGLGSSLAFAFLTWRLSTGVVGDALFHVGRIRKIEHVSGLSLTDISSFEHGAPHAGYAFPLLHAGWAGVAQLAGVDAAAAFVYLGPLCGMAAILGIAAVAHSLTGWRLAGYLAAVPAAWDLCTLINGLIMQINQPPPFSFYILTPAAVLLFLAALRGVLVGAYAAGLAVMVIALVHPTYAIPCLAIMAGITVASWRAHLAVARAAVVAIGVATAGSAVVAAWIWWVAIDGGQRREIITHSDEFVHRGTDAYLMYPWAPVFGRGYVLVSILALGLLVRYRRTLPTAGAMLGPLALLLLPGVNTVVMSVVGMGQFHRFWQVLPWPAALAAAALVAARLLGRWSYAVAAVLAVLLHWLRMSDMREFWREPTSVAVVAGLLLALACLIREPRRSIERGSGLAAAALVAATLVGPVALYHDHLLDAAQAGPHRPARQDLVIEITPGVVRWFAQHDDPIPTVLGEPHRVYELVGKVPVYAAALPEARTRAEPKIDTVGRRNDAEAFFDPATSPEQRHAILERRHVDYVLLDLKDQAAVAPVLLHDPLLHEVYRDQRFVILRVTR
jgi:hypothetical protein